MSKDKWRTLVSNLISVKTVGSDRYVIVVVRLSTCDGITFSSFPKGINFAMIAFSGCWTYFQEPAIHIVVLRQVQSSCGMSERFFSRISAGVLATDSHWALSHLGSSPCQKDCYPTAVDLAFCTHKFFMFPRHDKLVLVGFWSFANTVPQLITPQRTDSLENQVQDIGPKPQPRESAISESIPDAQKMLNSGNWYNSCITENELSQKESDTSNTDYSG